MARSSGEEAQRSTIDAGRALDVGRGAAILLVVYGHFLQPWATPYLPTFSPDAMVVWKLGASFLMPFFFALSGMGWRRSKTLRSSLREALTLILVAWLASVAVDLLRVAMTLTNSEGLFAQQPLTPFLMLKNAARMLIYGDYYSVGSLWFLAALGWTRLLAAVAARVGWIWGLAFSIVLIGVGLIVRAKGLHNYHQIMLLGVALTIFILAFLVRPAFAAIVRQPWLAALAFIVGGAVTLTTFALNNGCTFDMVRQCSPVFGVSMYRGAFGNLAWFWITAVSGVVWGLGFSALVVRTGDWLVGRLVHFGRNTIDILVANGLVFELINPQIERWIAPSLPAHGPAFLFALLIVSWVVTLGLAALLRPVFRKIRAMARGLATMVVAFRSSPSWTGPAVRVSASAHEPGSSTGSAERRAL
ncbi:MAG: acyltransferase [Alphaproteobacteria bacterium]